MKGLLSNVARTAVFILLGSGCCTTAFAQALTPLADQFHVVSQQPRTTLNRATGEYTTTVGVNVFNLGGRAVRTPLHLVIHTASTNIHVSGALGGHDSGPYNQFYLDGSSDFPGGAVRANASLDRQITFTYKRGVPFQYAIVPHGALIEAAPPVLNVTPFVHSIPAGQTLSVHMTASDPDGDVVTLSALPVIDNAFFVASNGVAAAAGFRFTPATNQVGFYSFNFTARDTLGLSTTTVVQIEVTQVNQSPVIAPMAPRTMTAGEVLFMSIPASDPEGGGLTLNAVPTPPSAILSSETKQFLFTPGATETGVFNIGFTAFDGALTSPTQHLQVTVQPIPVIVGGDSNQFNLVVDPIQSPTLVARQRVTGVVNVGDIPESRPMATSALITGLNPATVDAGDEVDVVITGQNGGLFETHFDASSVPLFGSGIEVLQRTVPHPHQLTARIRVQPSAQQGPRSVTVATSNETALSIIALNVGAGTTEITGALIDSLTSNAVASAMVTVQGTGFSTTTQPDGSFTISGVPPGEYTLIINGPNHQLLRFKITMTAGLGVELGSIPTAPTVFDPTAPASVSLLSILGRGLGGLSFTDADAARDALRDALLLCGGVEAGVLDEYGNQLNSALAGDGLMSLTAKGMDALTERLMRGETYALVDFLLPFSFGFEWQGTTRFTLAEWLDLLQTGVNEAWANPNDPDSALPILMFNRSAHLSADPPTLSPATRLNQAQAFLFVASLFSYMADPEGTNDYTTAYAPLAPGVMLASKPSLWTTLFPSAYADDPPTGSGRTWTSYWRGIGDERGGFMELQRSLAFNAFNQMSMVMASAGAAGGVGPLLATLPIVGLLETQIVSAFGVLELAQRVPEPPRMIRATVVDGANENPLVFVYFRRSPSDKATGGVHDERLVYSLYRFRNFNQPRDLVAVRRFSEPADELLMMDLDPLPGASFYAVTVTHLSSAEDDVDDAELSSATPWWNAPLVGINNPLINALRATRKSMSDYSEPGLVNVGAPPGLFQVSGLAVGADNVVYQSDVSGGVDDKKIIRIPDLGRGTPSDFAFTRFADPGHQGLAMDSHGALYSRNKASDALFGGRVFRFAQPNGSREHVGSINYFSQQLMFANPAMGGPIAVGPGADPVFSPEDVYVADTLAKQIKRIPVQSTQPALRRVGQSYADYPFLQQVIDIEVGGPSNLVYALAPAGNTILAGSETRLDISDFVGQWLEEEDKQVPGSLARVYEPGRSNQFVQLRMHFEAPAKSEFFTFYLDKIVPDDSPSSVRVVRGGHVLMDVDDMRVPLTPDDFEHTYRVEVVEGGVIDMALRIYYKGDLHQEDIVRLSAVPGVDPKPGRLIFVQPGTTVSSPPYDDFTFNAAATLGEALSIAQENDNILIVRMFTNQAASTLTVPVDHLLIAGLTGRYTEPTTNETRGAQQTFDWGMTLPVLKSASGRTLELSDRRNVSIAGFLFRDSVADNGGAISVEESDQVQIAVSRFVSNQATISGGALYFSDFIPTGTNFVDQCRFGVEGDPAAVNIGASGGALAAVHAKVHVRNSVFINNRGTQAGGAVYLGGLAAFSESTARSRFEACTFKLNASVGGFPFGGGAVYMRAAPAHFDHCLFEQNQGSIGGAVAGRGHDSVMGSSGHASLASCDFINNVGTRVGGAIAAFGVSEQAISFDYVFTGGYQFEIADSRFHTNTAEAAHGGAIFAGAIGSKVSVSDSEFIGNKSKIIGPENDGGAIAAGSLATTEISGSTFINNYAGNGGGAIYHTTGAEGTFHDCEFYGNEGSKGGAIEGSEWTVFTISDCIIGEVGRGNHARETGGGIYLRGATLHLSGSNHTTRIEGNHADSRGGGIYLAKLHTGFFVLDPSIDLTVQIDGVDITDNTAGIGGAIYIGIQQQNLIWNTIRIANSYIARNSATKSFHNEPTLAPKPKASGIVLRQDDATIQDPTDFQISNCVIEDHDGAGLSYGFIPFYVASISSFILDTTLHVENTRFSGNDVGIYWYQTAAKSTVENCLFHSNINGPTRVDLLGDLGHNITVDQTRFHLPPLDSSTGAALFYQPDNVLIEHSTFRGYRAGDGLFGIRTFAPITATDNYWGSAGGPHYPPANTNPDGAFIEGPNVTYVPYRTTE